MSDHTLKHFWQEARQILSQFWRTYVSPTTIAYRCVFTPKARRELCHWLRGAETMLRALLFMEAVHLCAEGALPAAKQSAPHPRAPREKRVHDPDHPEAWRVRFRMFDPVHERHRVPQTQAPAPLGPRLYNAWPLAERAEALRRVFSNPAPHARRLARKLKANRRRSARINMSGKIAPYVIPPILWDDVCIAFLNTERRLQNSS